MTQYRARPARVGLLACTLAVCAAAGCDGAGGDGPGIGSGGAPEPVSGEFRDTSLPLNDALSGSLLLLLSDEDDEAVRMDLRSGRYERIDPPSWTAIDEASNYMDVHPFPYSRDGFIVLEEGCGSAAIHCLHVQDGNARTKTVFEVPAFVKRLQISPDHRYVGMFRTREVDLSGATQYELYTIDGELLGVDNTMTDVRQFELLSGGRTLFVADGGRALWVSRGGSTEPDYTINVPDAVDGRIGSVAASPDGNLVAFAATAGNGQTSFWMATLADRDSVRFDEVGETALVEADAGVSWFVRSFSPDGRWLLLQSGGRASLPNSSEIGSGVQYFAMATGQGDPATVGRLPESRSVSVRRVYRYSELDWSGPQALVASSFATVEPHWQN